MLKVTLTTGEVNDVPFSSLSTVTIFSDGLSYTWSDIASFEVVDDPAPVPAQPLVETPDGTVVPPVEPPVDDTAATVAGALGPDGSPPPVDESHPAGDPNTPGETAPAEVIESTFTAVDTAVSGTADDPKSHLEQAIADVDAALAQWPDSPALADAKAQLAEVAADTNTPDGP